MTTRIMYVELKGGELNGAGRIGRVTLSRSGRSLTYRGRRLQSLRGAGYKANYHDVETGETYWVSGPRKDGLDRLYPGTVEVDEDVREEYWRELRGLPERAHEASFRSQGKHTR